MDNFIKDNSILLIPNSIKESIIKYIRKYHFIKNIKILSIEEFIKNLTFDYDEKTIYELMKLENINYDTAIIYLNNICYADENNKSFKFSKLLALCCKFK